LRLSLLDLLIAQLRKAYSVPTFVAQAVLHDPTTSKTMAVLGAEIGVSVRMVERSFRKEMGIDFESWRQVRLTKAVQLLVSGCSIKEVAFRVGYRQSSTLAEMFRQTFGTNPKLGLPASKDDRPKAT
jgi:transcriptional regulator GlxA family with amidase domain